MRTLVTGGSGFIGSAVVDRLAGAGHQVTVVDDLSTGRRENLADALASGRVELAEADLAGPELAGVVAEARPEVVYHLAAQIDVRRSVADPLHDARVNVLGTIALATAALEAGCRRLVFASSGGTVYGEPDPADLPIDERYPPRVTNPYGVSKRSAEDYLASLAELHGLEPVSLRLGNVYGPRQDPHGEAGVVAIFCNRLLAGEPVTIFGDGRQTRDYVFVEDVVDAFIAGGEHPGAPGSRVNVLGTIALAKAALAAGCRRLVFASSGGTVYGEPDPSALPIDERYPPRVTNPYGVSKRSAEDYLASFAELHGLEPVSLRLGNVYGPRQDPHGEAGVVAIFCNRLLADEPVTIFGDGRQTRDYVFVEDVVDAFMAGGEHPDAPGARVNIGTGVETSVLELYDALRGVAGFGADPEFAPARPGELARIALDCSEARWVLGWSPKADLAGGLARTWAWAFQEVNAGSVGG